MIGLLNAKDSFFGFAIVINGPLSLYTLSVAAGTPEFMDFIMGGGNMQTIVWLLAAGAATVDATSTLLRGALNASKSLLRFFVLAVDIAELSHCSERAEQWLYPQLKKYNALVDSVDIRENTRVQQSAVPDYN